MLIFPTECFTGHEHLQGALKMFRQLWNKLGVPRHFIVGCVPASVHLFVNLSSQIILLNLGDTFAERLVGSNDNFPYQLQDSGKWRQHFFVVYIPVWNVSLACVRLVTPTHTHKS